jgi:Rab GDP dissociation inhibitor
VEETFAPLEDGSKDHCYISSSYDATSHFETTAEDVLSLYQRITGKELDLTISADTTEADY